MNNDASGVPAFSLPILASRPVCVKCISFKEVSIMEERFLPQVFEHEEFGKVRVVLIDGKPHFVAADVCRVLEIGNPSQALNRLDDDEKGIIIIDTPGGEQQMLIVNESGLYASTTTKRVSVISTPPVVNNKCLSSTNRDCTPRRRRKR